MKPYDLYVRFLVTKGAVSHEAVNILLDDLSLKHITEDEFEKQYSIVHDNVPKPISDQISNGKYEGSFLKWMNVLQVKELWEIEPKFRTPETAKLRLIYDIHHDPILRVTLNALITKGQKVPDVVQDVNMKFAYMLSEAHVKLYAKFFWNPESMTRQKWREYLKLVSGNERNILFIALTEPIEALKTHLDLPTRLELSASLSTLLTNSYQKAKHYMRINTPDAGREARAWIGTTLAIADKYQKYSKADTGDFAKSIQMEFDYVQNEFITPDVELLAELQKKNAPKGDEDQEKLDV